MFKPYCGAIQASRRPSTLASYVTYWSSFHTWCLCKGFDSLSVNPLQVLECLQDGFDRFWFPLLTGSIGCYCCPSRFLLISSVVVLVSRLLRSFRLEKPLIPAPLPSWDLPTVLIGLRVPPFKPLDLAVLLCLSAKVAFFVGCHIGDVR